MNEMPLMSLLILTYRRGMEEIFGPITEANATQDEVYGNRTVIGN